RQERTGDEQAGEQEEGTAGATAVGGATGNWRGDEPGERETGEDEAVKLESAEVFLDRRHDRRDDQRLDRDHELDEKDAGGQLSAPFLEQLAPSHRGFHCVNGDGRRDEAGVR